MAICGTSLGIVISLPWVLFAARNLTPHPMVRFAVRSFISFCRIAAPLVYGMLGDWIGIEIVVTIAACLVLLTLPFTLALRPVVGWRATAT